MNDKLTKELLEELKILRKRFRACVIHGGTDEEFADAAVAETDRLIARAEKELTHGATE